MTVVWLRFAGKSLDDIHDFLAKVSPKAAADLYNDILDETDRLSFFPYMASIEPLLADEYEIFRSLVVRKCYKVIYFVEDETIRIADVWDCRRDPKALKKRIKSRK